jgi:hypothetical protein
MSFWGIEFSAKNTIMDNTNELEVKVAENGPLLVMGNVCIVDASGNKEHREKMTAFCRCGASQNKPFCDGQHQKIDFKD